MSSHVSLDSYVDIAMFFASQGCRYRGDLLPSEYSETNFEIFDLTDFREHWSKKIEAWQMEYPGGGEPFGNCEKLEDIKFCTLFLQHPLAAMLLWKVMRAFYNLDRVVCAVLPASRSAVIEWEAMDIFEYLKASKVEKKWRRSLSNMRRDIEAKHVVTKKNVLAIKSQQNAKSIGDCSWGQKRGFKCREKHTRNGLSHQRYAIWRRPAGKSLGGFAAGIPG